ncbi:Oidioi.mRNA.OKI2018_I69.chr2.g8173.t1.cds [Oikopleura dioica]|uniref:Oidioi.mRNA.OKI2018_I69.chr2.g8173.t1.cds n=1 Tax=Oikopleura dioica TaxID=34765 RepID=A0ABN7TCY1_OIKDI|nr:Oidioi.mRNA.OKI2018_I69.chr2.g8173.t1.cds [Oikopleura dioica]
MQVARTYNNLNCLSSDDSGVFGCLPGQTASPNFLTSEPKLSFFPPHPLQPSPVAHEVQPQLQPQTLIQQLPQSLPVSPTINEISKNSPCSSAASLPPAISTCAPITTQSSPLPNSPILSCDKPQPQIIPKREVISPTSFLSPQPASQPVFHFQKPKQQRSNSLPVSPKVEPGLLPRKKNKKGPAPKLFGNETCKICDAKATGFHYNVLSCEACKNFFRRAVVHKLKYRCKIGAGSCSVLAGHRPRCQFCRMQKCRNMGMKDEYINRINRQRKNAKQIPKPPEPMPQKYRVIIEGLREGWDGMAQIMDDVTSLEINSNTDRIESFNFMSQMAAVKVKKIIYFCKHIPMWKEMPELSQITLIKSGLTEAMVLYNTTDYDGESDQVKFIDGIVRPKDAFRTCGFSPEMIDAIFGIWRYCYNKKFNDSTTVALLMAATLTSPDRHFISMEMNKEEREKTEALHQEIITALQWHLKQTTGAVSFARAVSVLTQLRNISDQLMPRQLNDFNVLGVNMSPLFAEIYSH